MKSQKGKSKFESDLEQRTWVCKRCCTERPCKFSFTALQTDILQQPRCPYMITGAEWSYSCRRVKQ